MAIYNVINDIMNLRGAEVEIFGQKTVLESEVGEGYVDIIDILERMKRIEETSFYIELFDEEKGEFGERERVSLEEYMQELWDRGDIKEVESGNSFNWEGKVSNDFNYTIYEDMGSRYLIEFKVHRFGDVRANYTETVLLEVDDLADFWGLISECDKYIIIGEKEAHVSALRGEYEVYNIDGVEYLETVYDLEDIKPEESNIKTYDNWEGSLNDYLEVGDLVDEKMVEHFINVLPPLTYTEDMVQVSEPYSIREGKNTYTTFVHTAEGWKYAGHCHRNSDKHLD